MSRSGFTQFQQQRMLSRAFGSVAYTEPTVLYLGVSTTTINENGTGATPPTDVSYARVALDNNTSNWQNLSVGTGRQNAVPIEWVAATTNWGTITYVSIHDAPTGGNMLYYSELVTPKTVGIDDVLRADIGNVQIRIQPTV
jgi:hypothetical protein